MVVISISFSSTIFLTAGDKFCADSFLAILVVFKTSLLKIKGTLVRQKTTELLRKALGPQALPYLPEQFDEGWNEMPIGPDYAGPIAKQYFNMRKISIYGGSNEIQKNIVAKASFGL